MDTGARRKDESPSTIYTLGQKTDQRPLELDWDCILGVRTPLHNMGTEFRPRDRVLMGHKCSAYRG